MTFWTKYYAKQLAQNCAEKHIESSDTNSLVSPEPLYDWDYFNQEMESWCSDPFGDQERKVFKNTYKEIIQTHKSK